MIDTTPFYPRPDDIRVFEAMSAVFRVVEHIAPETEVASEAIVRFVIAHGVTTAQAMWAIHELAERGGFEVLNWREMHTGRYRVNSHNPPAGLSMIQGAVHIDGGTRVWSALAFVPNHHKMDEIRKSIRLNVDSGKQIKQKMPDNPAVRELCKLLSERKSGESESKTARAFTKEPIHKWPKAQSLLRQARRYPHLWKSDK